jgi:single-strand DNA-binding protein
VEGRIQTRQWEDQSGNKRYTTELIADRVTSLERREREDGAQGFAEPGGSYAGGSSPQGAASSGPASSAQDFDDLPF